MSRAGKAKGKNSKWFNLRFSNPPDIGGELAVNLQEVKGLKFNDSGNNANEEVMMLDEVNLDTAKQDEINNWKSNKVFSEVPDKGKKCISTRWVCTLKTTPDGIITKARLVARGFEEYQGDLQKDSPTCAHESLGLILAIIAQRKWKVNSMDIKTAFLQGQSLEKIVYIRPPKDAYCKDVLWKLDKCVYGLSDASLHWYNKVKSVMISCGGKISKVDPTVFYWSDSNGDMIGVLACHVDDFIWSGVKQFEKDVISSVRNKFKVSKEDCDTFIYCGIDISDDGEQIYLSQGKYTDSLVPIDINPTRAMEKCSELNEEKWLGHQSRPGLLFETNSIAMNMKDSTVKDVLDVNKLITKSKMTKMAIKYQHLGPNEDLSLMVFSDASLGNLKDGGSQGGFFILLVGKSGKFSPIWWSSRKIRRVVRSTLAAETLAMADAINVALFLSTLYSELVTGNANGDILPLICVSDCKSLVDAVKSSKFVTEKRLRIEMSGIKELVNGGRITKFLWCESKKQLADCLTKSGSSSLLLRKTLSDGIIDIKF